jgi:hypothetical protein
MKIPPSRRGDYGAGGRHDLSGFLRKMRRTFPEMGAAFAIWQSRHFPDIVAVISEALGCRFRGLARTFSWFSMMGIFTSSASLPHARELNCPAGA